MRSRREFDVTERTQPRFSLVQHVYAPLILSLPVSLALTSVLLLTITLGVVSVSPSRTIDARFAEALTLLPQVFVVCVLSCWLLFGLCLPFSVRRLNRAPA